MTQNIENIENSSFAQGDQDRRKVLEAMLERAPFDGWTGLALQESAKAAGFSSEKADFLFPDGVRDILRFWEEGLNKAAAKALASPEAATLKIREKVELAVLAKIGAMRPHKEAARRASAFLALPQNAALGASLNWKTADTIWRSLNDKSTDFNYYTKRGILSGVILSSIARWLSDDSEDNAATKAFVRARINNVMQIEKVKAQVRNSKIDFTAPIKLLSKLRYGSR